MYEIINSRRTCKRREDGKVIIYRDTLKPYAERVALLKELKEKLNEARIPTGEVLQPPGLEHPELMLPWFDPGTMNVLKVLINSINTDIIQKEMKDA